MTSGERGMQSTHSERRGINPRTILFTACLTSLIFLYAAIRIHFMLTPPLGKLFIDTEELVTGNIAQDLGRGLRLPLFKYKDFPYGAGQIFVGAVSYPFMLVFGPNLFALRCAAVTFGMATMVLWFVLLWRFISPLAAIVTGTLITLAPDSLVYLTTTAKGNHAESSVITAAVLYFFLASYDRRLGSRAIKLSKLAITGALAGFGAFFILSGFIVVAFFSLAILFVEGRKTWPVAMGSYLTGLAVGLSSFVFVPRQLEFHQIPHHTMIGFPSHVTPWGFVGSYVGNHLGDIVRKFVVSTTSIIPRSLGFYDFFHFRWQTWAWFYYLLIILFGFFYVVLQRREILFAFYHFFSGEKNLDTRQTSLELVILSFPIFFLVAYSMSLFDMPPNPKSSSHIAYTAIRYMMPMFPFLITWFALGFSTMIRRSKRLVPLMVLESLAALSILLPLSSIYFSTQFYTPDFASLRVRGCKCQSLLDALIVRKTFQAPDINLGFIRNEPARYKSNLMELSGRKLVNWKEASEYASNHFPKSLVQALFRGHGFAVGQNIMAERDGKIEEVLALMRSDKVSIPPEFQFAFLEGIGKGIHDWMRWRKMEFHEPLNLNQILDLHDLLEPSEAAGIISGIGQSYAQFFHIPGGLTAEFPEEFWEGIGRKLRSDSEIFLLRYDLAIDDISNLPKRVRPAVLKGWQAEYREYYSE
jgi:hypothetical protein